MLYLAVFRSQAMLGGGHGPVYANEMEHSPWKTRVVAGGRLLISLGLMAYTILHGVVMSHYDPETTIAFHWLLGLGFFAGTAYSPKVLVKGEF